MNASSAAYVTIRSARASGAREKTASDSTVMISIFAECYDDTAAAQLAGDSDKLTDDPGVVQQTVSVCCAERQTTRPAG